MVNILAVTKEKVKLIRKVYLLIPQYISIVVGLKSDLSWAWKSGKKPSPIKEIIKNRFPKEKNVIAWSDYFVYWCLKKLNIMIPIVATKPIINFLWVSLSFESFTLEKNTPIIITESKLQDFAITIAGKDA